MNVGFSCLVMVIFQFAYDDRPAAKWKRLRLLFEPSTFAEKLRNMFIEIRDSCDKLQVPIKARFCFLLSFFHKTLLQILGFTKVVLIDQLLLLLLRQTSEE